MKSRIPLVDKSTSFLRQYLNESYFVSNDEFENDLIELKEIRNEINQKLENTDYHAVITYSSWW